ncbi:MAG: cache domain-containing protein [Vulcanimicrobiota bacterium]
MHRYSLKSILIIFFLLVSIVPVVILGGTYYHQKSQEVEKRINQEFLLLAKSLAEQTELYLMAHTQAMQTLADEISLDTGFDIDKMNRTLEITRSRYPGFRHLFVMNLDGVIIGTAPIPDMNGRSFMGRPYRDRDYYREVLAHPMVYYSHVLKGETSGRAVLAIATPVRDSKGDMKAILAGTLHLDRIREIMEETDLSDNIKAVLIDQKGFVISHPDPQLRDRISNLSQEAVAPKALARESGITRYVSYLGEERVAGYTCVEPVGWALWVSKSVKELNEGMRSIAITTALLVVFSLLVDLILAFYLAGKLSKPLGRLVESARSIGEGNFGITLPWKETLLYREVGSLADSTENMAQMLRIRDEKLNEYSTGLEKKVEERTRELTKANEEMVAMQAQLIKSEKLSAVGQLAAGVAHELNNPLVAILTNVQSFPDATKPEKVRKRLSMLEEAVMRCKTIVEKLLNFSRLSQRDDEVLDLRDVAGNTLEFLERHVEKEGIALARELLPAGPMQGNRAEISQVITNLIFNAKDALASKSGGEPKRITVKTFIRRSDEKPEEICCTITDNGAGIPEEIMGKILDPFFTTKEIGKGTGLGLWVSYQIVRKYSGELEASSEVGKGSTFTLTFPSAQGKGDQEPGPLQAF